MNRVLVLVIALILATALGIGGRYLFDGGDGKPAPTSIGKALVGGPFSMIDHEGKAVTQVDYAGRYMMIYFGYTYCPDVCPLGLQTISEALDMYAEAGGDAKRIAPLFVSVDPERDTPKVMAEYVGNFHPALRGLTGSVEQVTAMAKVYRVYYAKSKDSENSEDYLMDHMVLTYLMGPDGAYLSHFGHKVTPEQIVERLKKVIR